MPRHTAKKSHVLYATAVCERECYTAGFTNDMKQG